MTMLAEQKQLETIEIKPFIVRSRPVDPYAACNPYIIKSKKSSPELFPVPRSRRVKAQETKPKRLDVQASEPFPIPRSRRAKAQVSVIDTAADVKDPTNSTVLTLVSVIPDVVSVPVEVVSAPDSVSVVAITPVVAPVIALKVKKVRAKAVKVVEIGLTATERYSAAFKRWTPILDVVSADCERVYQLRTGLASVNMWFSPGQDPAVRRRAIESLIGLEPAKVAEFVSRLPFHTAFVGDEALVAAARLLVRLIDVSRGAFSDLRAWFGRGKDEFGWFSGMSALARTNFNIGAVSLEHLLWLIDSYYDFAIRFCRMPNCFIADVVKSHESGKDLYGKQCWNLMPFATLIKFAYLQGLHPMAVLTVLWTKEREFCGKRGYIPSLRPDGMARHLTAITQEELLRIPRHDQQHVVDWQYAFGLPGDVRLPEKIVYGWDFSKVHSNGMHLVAVTEGGQAVYKDAKGATVSEGHPLQLNAVVKAWGSPALQVWVTRENYAELLPSWYNPPTRCPWSWYSRFGNGIYREDGTALHPDARLRPPVTWLESTNV